jgi:hypothetical protein
LRRKSWLQNPNGKQGASKAVHERGARFAPLIARRFAGRGD